jgi:hypothetical protein
MNIETFRSNIRDYLKYLGQVVLGDKHSFKVKEVTTGSSNGNEFCDVYYYKINDRTRYSLRIVFYADHAAIVHGKLDIVDVKSDIELLRALERSKFQDISCLDVVLPVTEKVSSDFSWGLCTLLMWVEDRSGGRPSYRKSDMVGMDYDFWFCHDLPRAPVYSCLDLHEKRRIGDIHLNKYTNQAMKTGEGAFYIDYAFLSDAFHLKLEWVEQKKLIRAACCEIVEDAFDTLKQLDAFFTANVYCLAVPPSKVLKEPWRPFD